MSTPGTPETGQLESVPPIDAEPIAAAAIPTLKANPNSDAKHDSKDADPIADFYYDLLLTSEEHNFLNLSNEEGFVAGLEGILNSKDKMLVVVKKGLLATLFKSLIGQYLVKNPPNYQKTFEHCNRLFEFWTNHPDAIVGIWDKLILSNQISQILCNYVSEKAKQQNQTAINHAFSSGGDNDEDKITNPSADFLVVFYRCVQKILDVLEQNTPGIKGYDEMAFRPLLNLMKIYKLLGDVPNLNHRSNFPEKLILVTAITKIVDKYFKHIDDYHQNLFDSLNDCIQECSEFSIRLEFHKIFINLFNSIFETSNDEQVAINNELAFLKYFADVVHHCTKEEREIPALIRDNQTLFFQILHELTKGAIQDRRQAILTVLRQTLDNDKFWIAFGGPREEIMAFLNRDHVTDSPQFFEAVHFLAEAKVNGIFDLTKFKTMMTDLHEIEKTKIKANAAADSAKETKKDTGPVSSVSSATSNENTFASPSQPNAVEKVESKRQQSEATAVNAVATAVQSTTSEVQQEQVSYAFTTLEHLQGRNTHPSAPAVDATAQTTSSALPVPENNKF